MSRPLTVLLLTDLYLPVRGGLERHVDELASYLVADGHTVHVATCTPRPQPGDPRVTTHRVRTAVSHVVPNQDPDRPFHPPNADPLARRDLRRIIDETSPDVVHGHSWIAHSLPRRLDMPVVLTAHDYGLVCQRKTLFDSRQRRCSGPRGLGCISCGAEQYGWARSTAGALGTRVSRSRLHADHVIAVSEAAAGALRPWLDVPISVLLNWVDDGQPAAGSRPAVLPRGDFVLYAGDSGEHKGVGVLLDAWAGNNRPGADLFLATTRDVGRTLPTGVSAGSLRPADMPLAWAAATVAVVPSLWNEPCGLVVLEAMRAGTPVVASRVGGMPELIRDDIDGLLVPPGDTALLIRAVQRLLDDGALRRRLGDSASDRAHDFAPGVIIPRLVDIYRGLISA